MSERKTVAWFSDEGEPNTFFLTPALRTPSFRMITIVAAIEALGGVLMLLDYRTWSQSLSPLGFVLAFLGLVAYPYYLALDRHARIYKRFREAGIREVSSQEPWNDALDLAELGMCGGLLVTFLIFALILFNTWSKIAPIAK